MKVQVVALDVSKTLGIVKCTCAPALRYLHTTVSAPTTPVKTSLKVLLIGSCAKSAEARKIVARGIARGLIIPPAPGSQDKLRTYQQITRARYLEQGLTCHGLPRKRKWKDREKISRIVGSAETPKPNL